MPRGQGYYLQQFRTDWLYHDNLKEWLRPVEGDTTKAFCRFCSSYMNARFHDFQLHLKTKKHKIAEASFKEGVRLSGVSGDVAQHENDSNESSVGVSMIDGKGSNLEPLITYAAPPPKHGTPLLTTSPLLSAEPPRAKMPRLKNMDSVGSFSSGPTLQVYGMGVMTVEPDVIEFTVFVQSTKMAAENCKEDVQKTLDVITDVITSCGIMESCLNVSKNLSVIDSKYHLQAEVDVECSSLQELELICNTLVEKLGNDITISNLDIRHSVNKLQSARRQVSLSATEEAQQKAEDLAATLGQDLGPPLKLEEEEVQENPGVLLSYDPTSPLSQFKISTLELETRVNIIFELLVEK